jgi:ABC-type lipoprotein release transport system permease subunit
LFGISAADPFTYLLVGIALLTTVLLAALIPALRAARVDPLAAIRLMNPGARPTVDSLLRP